MTNVIVGALIGGALYRARGAGLWPGRPWWQLIFATAYGLLAFSEAGLGAGLIVWGLTTGATLLGHACYLRLGNRTTTPAAGTQDEWYGRWIPFDPFWHDVCGLAVSGILITAPCGLALMLSDPLAGALIIASGALKGPAYVIGNKTLDAILWGELITGAALWGSLALVVTIGH